jgi:hypothetical protein
MLRKFNFRSIFGVERIWRTSLCSAEQQKITISTSLRGPVHLYHTSTTTYGAGKPPKISSSSARTIATTRTGSNNAGGAQLRSARVMMRKRFGQHLLKNPDVVESIVAAAQIQPTESVFEIGPGTGNMTVHLLKQARVVYAAELDPRLYSLLLARVAAMGEVAVVEKKKEEEEEVVVNSRSDHVPSTSSSRSASTPSSSAAAPSKPNPETYLSKLQVVRDDFLAVPLPPFDALVANIPYQVSKGSVRRKGGTHTHTHVCTYVYI